MRPTFLLSNYLYSSNAFFEVRIYLCDCRIVFVIYLIYFLLRVSNCDPLVARSSTFLLQSTRADAIYLNQSSMLPFSETNKFFFCNFLKSLFNTILNTSVASLNFFLFLFKFLVWKH